MVRRPLNELFDLSVPEMNFAELLYWKRYSMPGVILSLQSVSDKCDIP